MDDQAQDQPTIVSLRIELDTPPFGPSSVSFTLTDDAGATLTAPVSLPTELLVDNLQVLANIAAQTAEPVGGLVFGQGDETRVIFQFDGHNDGYYRFGLTLAFPSGDGGYMPASATASVSDASLARLVAGFQQALDAGQGTYHWIVAD